MWVCVYEFAQICMCTYVCSVCVYVFGGERGRVVGISVST